MSHAAARWQQRLSRVNHHSRGWLAVVPFILAAWFLVCCRSAIPDLQAEIVYLRRLAARGDLDSLADTLDSSMVLIPAGEFTLGSLAGPLDEQPPRQIALDAYQIDRFEVTNAQYQRFLLETHGRPPQHWSGLDSPDGQADWPVTGVSWAEASAYCDWAGKRLPSEAEWEKACRGPEGSVYPWGDGWDAQRLNTGIHLPQRWPASVEEIWLLLEAPSAGDEGPHPMPVGSYPSGASAYGVLDMAGNATEWTLDWYTWQGYQDLPERNPVGTGPPWNHSVRGSAWVDKDGEQSLVEDLSRCSKRNSSHTSNDPRIGFRCAQPDG